MPNIIVIIDVENENATAGQLCVPSLLPAVLDDVVFIGNGIVANEVGRRGIVESRHGGHRHCGCQLLRGEPAHEHTFVGGIAAGEIALPVVIASFHEVPVADHRHSCAVIKIGQPEAVAVLMADGTERGFNTLTVNPLLHTAVNIDVIFPVATGDRTPAAVII